MPGILRVYVSLQLGNHRFELCGSCLPIKWLDYASRGSWFLIGGHFKSLRPYLVIQADRFRRSLPAVRESAACNSLRRVLASANLRSRLSA